EDGTLTASGTVNVAGVATGEAAFQALTGAELSGTYGEFTFDESTGAWSYALDNALPAVQALKVGQVVTDTLTVKAADGTTENIVVTITGTNDPADITGDLAGAVQEDGTLTASGTVSVADADTGEAMFQALTGPELQGTYGAFTFDETTGEWTYTLDNDLPAVQALKAGQVVTDTLTVKALDGTTEDIVVTITGTNDPADITGDLSGAVQEDGTLTASGTGSGADAGAGIGRA